ncbi:hypothetical protein [Cochlodiniinecator piscidefendens]|uniref:hypothetical protein n=1 Tax=Cochlodiniinecator piscidefendens TaxID=2715756 RepID=UPI001407975D|nr:hypothetical protein [Cochlodiniinecator piscidefendens]
MSYGGLLRTYAYLLGGAIVVIFVSASYFNYNVAPEMGAVIIVVAIYFGAGKLKKNSPLIVMSDKEATDIERRKLRLDATFAIVGTLVNGFSSVIDLFIC